MEHIKLLLTFFNLILGLVIFMFLRNIHGLYRNAGVFSFMAFYTLAFNLLLIEALVGKYININLPNSLAFAEHPVFIHFVEFSFIVLLAAMAFLQYQIFGSFKTKTQSPVMNKVLYLTGTILSAALLGAISLRRYYPAVSGMIFESCGDLLFLSELVILVLLWISSKKERDLRKKSLMKSYSLFFLTRYPLIFLMLFVPETIRFYSSISVLFYINLVPLFWTKFFFKEGTLNERKEGPIRLPDKITAREKEIIDLVIAGKSNSEIEKILFISSHTVKNHIYNIYRKLKIKNRYELISRYGR